VTTIVRRVQSGFSAGQRAETTKEKHRTDITLSCLVATALAAITAAFLGSRLGTAGTIIGAGLASLVSTVAGALYQHSLDRTSNRVRSRRTAVLSSEPEPSPVETTLPMDRPPATGPRRLRWRTAAALTALAFVIGMAAVTGVELLNHGPISGGDNGTTIGSLFGQSTKRDTPTTTPSHPTTTTTPPTTSPPPTNTPTPTPTTVPPTTTTTPPTTSPPTTTSAVPPVTR